MVGRFTSTDSIVPDPADPQSFNRYTYVRNRPLSAVDPSGHFDLPPVTIEKPIIIGGSGPGNPGFDPGSIQMPGGVPYNPYLPGISYGGGSSYQPNISFNAVGNQIQYLIWLRSMAALTRAVIARTPSGTADGPRSRHRPRRPPCQSPAFPLDSQWEVLRLGRASGVQFAHFSATCSAGRSKHPSAPLTIIRCSASAWS
jgi:hypothetical protein